MGANAQTTVPDFVAETVLTAAKLDISAATGVPVFATTVTRDAAFGGANKVLAEGQTCYLEDANVVQYYDGAAWATVGPTAAPTSGLVVVKAETTVTAQATITVDNIFTSTYSNYVIRMAYEQSSPGSLQLQFRVGGVTATTNYNRLQLQWYSATVQAAQSVGQTTASFAASAAGIKSTFELMVFSPFIAQPTLFTSFANVPEAYTTPVGQIYTNNHSTATAYDGFIITGAGNITGNYTIYGYGKTL